MTDEGLDQLETAAQWLLCLKDGGRGERYEAEKPKAWAALRAALEARELAAMRSGAPPLSEATDVQLGKAAHGFVFSRLGTVMGSEDEATGAHLRKVLEEYGLRAFLAGAPPEEKP